MKQMNSFQTFCVILMLSLSVNGDIDAIFDDTKVLKDLSSRYNLLVYKVNDVVFTHIKLVNGVLNKTPELSKEIEDSISKYGFSALKNVSRIIQNSEALECVSKPSLDIKAIAQQGGKSYQKCVDDLIQRISTFPELKSTLDSFLFSKNLSTVTTEILNCRQSKEARATCENKTLESFATFVKEAERRVEQFVSIAEGGVVIVLKCYEDALKEVNKVTELLKQIKVCVLKFDIVLDLNLINLPSFPELFIYQKASTSKPAIANINTLISALVELELLYNKIVQQNFNSILRDELVNVLNSNFQDVIAYIKKEETSENPLILFCLKLSEIRVGKNKEQAFNILDKTVISLVETKQRLQKLIKDLQTAIGKTYSNHVQLRDEKQSTNIDNNILETLSNLRNRDGKFYEILLQSVYSSVKDVLSTVYVAMKDVRLRLRVCVYKLTTFV